MIILFCFVIQAVSYEFRSKPSNIFGHRTFEIFLYSSMGPWVPSCWVLPWPHSLPVRHSVLISAILPGSVILSFHGGKHPYRGLEAALEHTEPVAGTYCLFPGPHPGNLYFINNIEHDAIVDRAKKVTAQKYHSVSVVVFLTYVVILLLSAKDLP